MKKSIIIFFIFVILTYFIGTLDKIYKINSLFLFITLNLILILLSIFQILNLKKKYPKIYLVNPPVICTIFTFLIPFSLTNVFLVQSISELIINSDNLFKLFFLIINSFNLMWAGYWSADYFRSKNLFYE
jgi:membrane-associated HD superfamily phosphohydrolase